VLVPGASRPVGRAIARKFGDAGAKLILPVFDWPDSIQEMEHDFGRKGYDYFTLSVDLRKKEEVIRLADTIRNRHGRLNILINNIDRGGMPIVHGSYDLPHNHDQWDLEFDTTVKAKWLLFHHCFPLMAESEGGAVVNISSIASETGRSGPAAVFFNDGYSAANRAVAALTETWAREAAPNVRVNELALGFIRSRHGEDTRGWAALRLEDKEKLRNAVLLGRTGLPEEVAEAVFFLAITATYMTGGRLTMDGGYLLGSTRVPPMPRGVL
jgi:3-oxoacyl-[acyl-carrier protein] reductase